MATCFIGIPTIPSFEPYYREVLARTVVRAGLEPVRADDIDKRRAVTDQIRAGVSEAAVCVLDFTGRSATVIYVFGMAQAMGKPVVLLAQNPADIPYDLRLGRFIAYHPGTARWEDMLSMQLQTALRDSRALNFGTAP